MRQAPCSTHGVLVVASAGGPHDRSESGEHAGPRASGAEASLVLVVKLIARCPWLSCSRVSLAGLPAVGRGDEGAHQDFRESVVWRAQAAVQSAAALRGIPIQIPLVMVLHSVRKHERSMLVQLASRDTWSGEPVEAVRRSSLALVFVNMCSIGAPLRKSL